MNALSAVAPFVLRTVRERDTDRVANEPCADTASRPFDAAVSIAHPPPAARLTTSLLFLLAGLAALGALSTNIILSAFPDMAGDLGVSTKDLGATLSSFFVAFAVGQLLVGPLADRFGRQRLVLGGRPGEQRRHRRSRLRRGDADGCLPFAV